MSAGNPSMDYDTVELGSLKILTGTFVAAAFLQWSASAGEHRGGLGGQKPLLDRLGHGEH